MKQLVFLSALVIFANGCFSQNTEAEKPKVVSIFDGKTFRGWEGDTNKTWRIENGALVGGSLETKVPHNEFICTERQFTNFVLRIKCKLEGTEGFINGGVQVRSKRVPNHFEVSGYQADLGDPGWWGSLYDEARRNKLLVKSDMEKIKPVLKRSDWNQYEIRCEGKRIQAWLNGVQTFDYLEADDSIAGFGVIALQVHGGGKAKASYKDITVEDLP